MWPPGDRKSPGLRPRSGGKNALARGPVENSCHFIAHFSTQGSHEFPWVPMARAGKEKGHGLNCDRALDPLPTLLGGYC